MLSLEHQINISQLPIYYVFYHLGDRQPRSQGPLSSFLEKVRERILGTRLGDRMRKHNA